MFAYQGVYQRHLVKHLEKQEISDAELAPIIAESHRLANELATEERKSIQVLDDAEPDLLDGSAQPPESNLHRETPETPLKEEEEEEEMADAEEADEEDGELSEDEEHEAQIAIKMQLHQANVAGNFFFLLYFLSQVFHFFF